MIENDAIVNKRKRIRSGSGSSSSCFSRVFFASRSLIFFHVYMSEIKNQWRLPDRDSLR